MELIARVLITIPDDKWQEFLSEEIETKKETLERNRRQYGDSHFKFLEDKIPADALNDIKWGLGKKVESILQHNLSTGDIPSIKFIEFIEFEESEVK